MSWLRTKVPGLLRSHVPPVDGQRRPTVPAEWIWTFPDAETGLLRRKHTPDRPWRSLHGSNHSLNPRHSLCHHGNHHTAVLHHKLEDVDSGPGASSVEHDAVLEGRRHRRGLMVPVARGPLGGDLGGVSLMPDKCQVREQESHEDEDSGQLWHLHHESFWSLISCWQTQTRSPPQFSQFHFNVFYANQYWFCQKELSNFL